MLLLCIKYSNNSSSKRKKKFLKIPPLSRVPFHLSFWIIEITGENEKIEKPTECTVTYQEWGSASWLVKLSLRLPRAVALTVLYQPPPEWSRVFPSFINLARKRKSKTLRNFFLEEPPRFLYDSLENIFNRERKRKRREEKQQFGE